MPTPDGTTPLEVTAAFEQLGRIVLAEHTMESLLQQVCDLAAQAMPADAVSVTVIVAGRPETPAFTGQMALDLDERQYEAGDGPCLTAAGSGPVDVPDTRTEQRWRGYMDAAVQHGCLSSLSVPLLPENRDRVRAALNMYSGTAGVFDGESLERAQRFGGYAGVAVANMQAYRAAVQHGEHLQTALQSRGVIDQAKGILMERHKATADQAFQMLAALSMERNVKVRVIAEAVVRTGELSVADPV